MAGTAPSSNLQAFLNWRHQIQEQLSLYRGWLIDHNLQNSDTTERLARIMASLRSERLTIAIVGERGRGKTQLINALFLSHYSTTLPTGPGGVTLCPVELMHDPAHPHGYIRLLPVETRQSDDGSNNADATSVRALRAVRNTWHQGALDLEDPESIRRAFERCQERKAMAPAEAKKLGFEPSQLPASPQEADKVLVPAWRYAIISLDHSLLKQGLVVIDTPGTNCPGMISESVASMTEQLQGIVLLLSASAGVTATDLGLWQRHIAELALSQDNHLCAVLNQIDSLPAPDREQISALRLQAAQALRLDPDSIYAVSAQQGYEAQQSGDLAQLEASGLLELERLLSQELIHQREQQLRETVVSELHAMLHTSRKNLLHSRKLLNRERKALTGEVEDGAVELSRIMEEVRLRHTRGEKKLKHLQLQQQGLQEQRAAMDTSANTARLEGHLYVATTALDKSMTSGGMKRAIETYFAQVEQDLAALIEPSAALQATAERCFTEFEVSEGLAPLHHKRLSIEPSLTRLRELRRRSLEGDAGIKHWLRRKAEAKRFLLQALDEGAQLYESCLFHLDDWVRDVLLPLLQTVQEEMSNLHELDVNSLPRPERDLDDPELKERLADIEEELEDLDEQFRALTQLMERVVAKPGTTPNSSATEKPSAPAEPPPAEPPLLTSPGP